MGKNSGMGTVTVALAAGAAVVLIYFGGQGDAGDQRDKEIRQGCLTPGAVDQRCPELFPDVEHCEHEDCSGIKGAAGFFQDPSDVSGRTWHFTIRPDMREAPQKPGES